MNRLDPTDLRSRLQQAGAWSNKDLGQHFLIDEKALAAILEVAQVSSDDTVVEIGPGPGVLTEQLAQKAGRVIAFELDPKMADIIRTDFPQVELQEGDVLREAPAVVEKLSKYKVVANIPYQITTPLIKLFVEGGVQPVPESLTLLVQKEVGRRLTAPAKSSERGYLSVLCQYYMHMSYVYDVPARSFWPAPEVDSAVIHMQQRTGRLLPMEEERKFLRFVKTLFANPRKQLKNVVAGIRGISSEQVTEIFATLGLPTTARAQELTEEQWLNLYKAHL